MVHGTHDHLVPLRAARELAQRIPRCDYHEIPGAGHLPYATHPPQFNAVLDSFLDTIFAEP